jgi:hypothetical protein
VRTLLIAFLLLACSVAWAQNNPLMITAIPPNPPTDGCHSGWVHITAGWYCDVNDGAAGTGYLPHLDGIYTRVLSTTVDQGDVANGGTDVPRFTGWAAQDAVLSPYNGVGNVVGTCTNVLNATTCTFPANTIFSPTPTSDIFITGNSVAAYNTSFSLNGAPGATYTATGCIGPRTQCLASITFNQTSPVATGTGGNIFFGCARLLRGSIRPCKISLLTQHHSNSAVASSPVYPFKQAWANSQADAWTASKHFSLRQSIKVGTHYYHVVPPIDSLGGGTTSAVNPNNFSTTCTNATSLDNTVTWQDDCTNALPQESAIGTGYVGTTNDPQSGQWTSGGILINVNSLQCNSPTFNTACGALEVATGFPMFQETPYRKWFNFFNTATNDGFGNPGVIPHYKTVTWPSLTVDPSQIQYNGMGLFDLSEVFFFQKPFVVSAAGLNLTYAQFKGIFIQDYAADSFQQNYAAWIAGGAPAWQLNTRTNGYAGSGADGNSLDYAREIVKQAKLVYPYYSFGNQGVQISALTINAAGTWATANAGFYTPYFDQYLPESKTVFHHLQPAAPGDCPTVAGLAAIGRFQTNTVIGASDGTITSGAAVLTSASNPFNALMVGVQITVAGAGPAGGPLVTTILSFQSSGQVTLNTNASTSVTTAVMTVTGECQTGQTNQVTEGSMAVWMPWAVTHGMSAFEFFSLEGLCTWDSNYTVANGLVQGNQPTYQDCNNPVDNYQAIWNNAAIGMPSATSGTVGNSRMAGSSQSN